MPNISFLGATYTVDHAVKGADYVHGYDANGICVVTIDGINDFSAVKYDGTYLKPSACASEACNDVKHVNGQLVHKDGTPATHTHDEYLPCVGGTMTGNLYVKGLILTEGVDYGKEFPENAPVGKLFLKEVNV